MDLADETDGNRQVLKAFEAVIHGSNIVEYLIDVASRTVGRKDLGFRSEYILQGALSAFNLAREHGLLTDIHRNEEIGMRKCQDRAIEPAKCTVSLGEANLEISLQPDRWIPILARVSGVAETRAGCMSSHTSATAETSSSAK